MDYIFYMNLYGFYKGFRGFPSVYKYTKYTPVLLWATLDDWALYYLGLVFLNYRIAHSFEQLTQCTA
jgi:hypothetical protein